MVCVYGGSSPDGHICWRLWKAGCRNDNTGDTSKGKRGTIEEEKDFMFIVTDQDGASYEFDFDETPEGLDGGLAGDQVTVTYAGTVSEVDPFSGTILSVQKQ